MKKGGPNSFTPLFHVKNNNCLKSDLMTLFIFSCNLSP